MNEMQIADIVKKELSDRRYEHVKGVVETAAELAAMYGLDVGKARVAAWIHDYAREWSATKLRETAKECGVAQEYFQAVDLLHGPVAAALCPEVFGVSDEEIRMAVYTHTTGRPGMSIFEKVVFLADAIERGRNYEGVDTVRKLAATSIDHALAVQIDGTIRHLLDRQKPIFVKTVETRNELWASVHRSLSDKREQE